MKYALAVLSGVLSALPYVVPSLFPLAWFGFVPVFWAVRDADLKETLKLGLLMGCTAHLIGYPWIAAVIRDFGGMPFVFALAGYFALAVFQGGYYAVFIWITRWLTSRRGVPMWAALPAALTAVEFVYPMMMPTYSANSQFGFRLIIQIVDLGGVLLLTALVGLINAIFFEIVLWRRGQGPKPVKSAAAAAVLVILALGYGGMRISAIESASRSAPKLKVALLQSNTGARERLVDSEAGPRRLREMTAELVENSPDTDLALWPEGAYPDDVDTQEGLWEAVGRPGVPLLFGASLSSRFPNGLLMSKNSIVLVDKEGVMTDSYDKIKLIAFGERLPLGEMFPFLYEIYPVRIRMGWGTSTDPIRLGDWRLSPSICYEDLFPRLIRRLMAGDPPPHVLVNATNDSWYGRTWEQSQHVRLSSFRAVEHRRWLIRSTNTGYSTFTDATGKVVRKSGLWTRETLSQEVPMLEGRTLYTRLGDWPGWMALIILVLMALLKFR